MFHNKPSIQSSMDNLVSQIKAQDVPDTRLFIQGKLPAIFDLAFTVEEKRIRKLKSNALKMDEINRQIAHLQQKVKDLDAWLQANCNDRESDMQKIISIIPYIESRQIEPGHEIRFLEAFSRGENSNYLEAFIAKKGET